MDKSINIADVFPKHLFWDIDYSKLDMDSDKDIIIPRAMYATIEETFESDIAKLEQYYSKEDILYHLQNTEERISNKVCEWVALKYGVEKFTRFKL